MSSSFLKQRKKRLHDATQEDQRTPFERDRDRILYSSAFRRLAGVTQIVRAGEADIFHTRLTHSIKVAQLGRRIAQLRLSKQPEECALLGVDVEVVEAACLAHDLGHPPFGHVGEIELNSLVLAKNDADGYEGNAQSLRIISKLAVRFSECQGLDLTAATIAACVKYPWKRDENDSKKSGKWGVYQSEMPDFNFALYEWHNAYGEIKTAEAELMDWADDISYSVHDLEDFHRCQSIPWHNIFPSGTNGNEELIQRALGIWFSPPMDGAARLRGAYRRLYDLISNIAPAVLREPYEGTRDQRLQIRILTSALIGRYILAIRLKNKNELKFGEPCVFIDEDAADEIRILKQLTRDYIISSPSLVAQQKGYKRIIKDLFDDIFDEMENGKPRYLPKRFHHLFENIDKSQYARFTADCISSLTENEAISLHARLRGYISGSVLDPIVR